MKVTVTKRPGPPPKSKPPPKPLPKIAPVDFWSGKEGSAYTNRNRVDWAKRVPFWQHIIDVTNAGSFLEVGTNAGWNLRAIKSLRKDAVMSGVDLNQDALSEIQGSFDVEIMPGHKVAEFFGADACELAFTSGVLIHVPPEDLTATMTAIRDVSSQYVLAVEYDSPDAQEIEYRGRQGLLWKRPYGKLYQSLGLTLVESGVAEGFDQCHYWLLEK
jgi:pseudaminic acid biosynthesis-associated methylase